MEPKKYSLEDLKKISASTGISLEELQEQYGVYEFNFETCKSATDGYYKISKRYESKENHPELLAYIEGWKKATLIEHRLLNQHNLQHSIDFLNNCYPDTETLLKGIKLVEKNVGKNIAKMMKVIKLVKTNRQHIEYQKCVVYQFIQKIENAADEYFVSRLKNKYKLYQLHEVVDGFAGYEVDHWSKFPKFKNLLSIRMVKTVETPEELLDIAWVDEEHRLQKWYYFTRKLAFEKLLPTMVEFLSKVNQKDLIRYERPNASQRKIMQLFHQCNTEEQARRMLEIARSFFYQNDEEEKLYSNYVYDLYLDEILRIIRKNFPNPKLNDFPHIVEMIRHKKGELSIMENAWVKKSLRALEKPIPDFWRLYSQIHKEVKERLLVKWNSWGMKELEGLTTWEELSPFNFALLPCPGTGVRSRTFWSPTRSTFQAFICFLNKLIDVVPKGEEQTLVNLIKTMDKYLREVHVSGMFTDECIRVIKKMISNGLSERELYALYNDFLPTSECISDSNASVLEVIIDALFEKDISYLEGIYKRVKCSSRLKGKYMQLIVSKAIPVPTS